MISTTCRYAIRAMIAIVQQEEGGYVSSRRVGEVLDMQSSFLSKVLLQLTTADLLESRRGPNGGVRLARPACEIHLWDIVEAIDGAQVFDTCLFGWPECTRATPCPLHAAWGYAVDPFVAHMQTTSLAESASWVRAANGVLKTDKRLVNPKANR